MLWQLMGVRGNQLFSGKIVYRKRLEPPRLPASAAFIVRKLDNK